MTSEDKKHYLLQYRNAVRRQREAEDEIDQLRIGAMFPSIKQVDDMPHAQGGDHDLSDYAAQVDELFIRYKAELGRKWMIRKYISESINAIGNEGLSLLLHYRYLHLMQTTIESSKHYEGSELMQFEAIALDMGYSYDRVKHMHGEALERIEIPPELIRISEKAREM